MLLPKPGGIELQSVIFLKLNMTAQLGCTGMDVFKGTEHKKTIEPALAFKNHTFHVRTVLYLLEVFFHMYDFNRGQQ